MRALHQLFMNKNKILRDSTVSRLLRYYIIVQRKRESVAEHYLEIVSSASCG